MELANLKKNHIELLDIIFEFYVKNILKQLHCGSHKIMTRTENRFDNVQKAIIKA